MIFVNCSLWCFIIQVTPRCSETLLQCSNFFVNIYTVCCQLSQLCRLIVTALVLAEDSVRSTRLRKKSLSKRLTQSLKFPGLEQQWCGWLEGFGHAIKKSSSCLTNIALASILKQDSLALKNSFFREEKNRSADVASVDGWDWLLSGSRWAWRGN